MSESAAFRPVYSRPTMSNPQVFFDVAIKGEPAGRIVFEVRIRVCMKPILGFEKPFLVLPSSGSLSLLSIRQQHSLRIGSVAIIAVYPVSWVLSRSLVFVDWKGRSLDPKQDSRPVVLTHTCLTVIPFLLLIACVRATWLVWCCCCGFSSSSPMLSPSPPRISAASALVRFVSPLLPFNLIVSLPLW